VQPFTLLLPFGFWFFFHAAFAANRPTWVLGGLALLPVLPIATMLAGGFIGFGIFWVIVILSGLYVAAPWKKALLAIMPLVIYLGLSFTATYFSGRDALREEVWYRQSSLSSRFDRITEMFINFEFLNLDSGTHASAIESRLNQNILVGITIERYEAGTIQLRYGSTVPLWIFIPRFVWSGKPSVGGGGTLVSEATGLTFADGTSVGAGQPLEFYINFGFSGVLVLYMLFGYVLMRTDIGVVSAFLSRDVRRMMLLGVPGIASMEPGGNLISILVSVVGTIFMAALVAYVLQDRGLIADTRKHKLRARLARRWVPRVPF
jgi:hypothetical protein